MGKIFKTICSILLLFIGDHAEGPTRLDPNNEPTQEGPGNGDQELPMRPIRDIKNITRKRAYNEDNFKIISKVIKMLCIQQMKFRVESVDFILLYAFKNSDLISR